MCESNGFISELKIVQGLQNITHSAEEEHFELTMNIDSERARALGFDISDVSEAMQIALQGKVVTDYIEADKVYNIRVHLPRAEVKTAQNLRAVILFPSKSNELPIYLSDVADVLLVNAPAEIKRDNQMRIVEVSATISDDAYYRSWYVTTGNESWRKRRNVATSGCYHHLGFKLFYVGYFNFSAGDLLYDSWF